LQYRADAPFRALRHRLLPHRRRHASLALKIPAMAVRRGADPGPVAARFASRPRPDYRQPTTKIREKQTWREATPVLRNGQGVRKMNHSKLRTMLLATAGTLAIGAGAALAADCPIKIGGLAPLSAPGTVVGGEAMRDAMLIAQDDINKAGGVLGCDVEVVIADTEGLPEKAKAVMEKLITQDGVVAVGGGYHSSVGVASKDVADARHIPVVFAETWNDTITGDKRVIWKLLNGSACLAISCPDLAGQQVTQYRRRL
jgi:hypothetical protein